MVHVYFTVYWRKSVYSNDSLYVYKMDKEVQNCNKTVNSAIAVSHNSDAPSI